MNNNLENTYKTLLIKYDSDLNGYKYVLPTTRYLLKPGHMIKYIKQYGNNLNNISLNKKYYLVLLLAFLLMKWF